jgi:hypothetical protein
MLLSNGTGTTGKLGADYFSESPCMELANRPNRQYGTTVSENSSTLQGTVGIIYIIISAKIENAFIKIANI